jgi:hypothetical protein
MIRSRMRWAAAAPWLPHRIACVLQRVAPPWGVKQAPLGNVQVRAKGADEKNLADWIVHITTDADRQGDDGFVQAYARCASQAQPTDTASEWL